MKRMIRRLSDRIRRLVVGAAGGSTPAFASLIAMLLTASCVTATISFADADRPVKTPCVRVYYDDSSDPLYNWMGEMYAVTLNNLLGHFPEFQSYVSPIRKYKKGDIDSCKTTFYIGSYFNAEIPEAFMNDYATTTRNVVWMGYGIWKLGQEKMNQLFGWNYAYLTTLDKDNLDELGRPTFFKNILYKGETFWRYGHWRVPPPNSGLPPVEDKTTFLASFEMTALRVVDGGADILAWAEHNGTKERLPYAIRKGNRFYITDVPFTFMHEADRYMVVADLLFDMLGAEPRFKGKRPAVFRIEDVSSDTGMPLLNSLISALHEKSVPYQIALIPVFADPLLATGVSSEIGPYKPLIYDPVFSAMIERIKARGGDFIWHGVTHQYKQMRNPYNAATGIDFEFWDALANGPVPDDSVHNVLKKLDLGWYYLSRANIKPVVWEVPHYQASPLDYHIFSRTFDWMIGRMIYFQQEVTGKPAPFKETLKYTVPGEDHAVSAEREKLLAGMTIDSGKRFMGQIYPYEVYGDQYGLNILPENLGNVQPYLNSFVTTTRTVEDILQAAKRNRVLRDVWGSLFFHPHCLGATQSEGINVHPGDPQQVFNIIDTMRSYGYEFISLRDFITKQKGIKRPQPVIIRGDLTNEKI